MDPPQFERVAILGAGLIGGSCGLALRAKGLAGTVCAYSRSAETRRRAVARGAADATAESPEACVAGADLVYLATPVDAIVPLLKTIAPHLAPGCLVTDAGSSKERIVAAAERVELPAGASFVGGHPMAGSEAMGIEAAREDLFEAMSYVVTPTARTSRAAVERVKSLAAALGCRVLEMTPADHDHAVAAISHLPHLLAWSLLQLTEDRHAAGEPVYRLAAGSWASATRVAASGAGLWREILISNRGAVLSALDDFQRRLDELRELVAGGEGEALEQRLDILRAAKLAAVERRDD